MTEKTIIGYFDGKEKDYFGVSKAEIFSRIFLGKGVESVDI